MSKFHSTIQNILSTNNTPLFKHWGAQVLHEAVTRALILESFDIEDDVDYLMKAFNVRGIIMDYIEDPLTLYGKGQSARQTDVESSELPSEVAKKADKINPITISFKPAGDKGSYYTPKDSRIVINIFRGFINYMGPEGIHGDIYRDVAERDPLVKEALDPDIIAGVIAHELTHWLEETLYNKKASRSITYAKGLMKKARGEDAEAKILDRHKSMSDVEISSYIAMVRQLKRGYTQEEWDELTFDDVFEKIRSFAHSFKTAVRGFTKDEVAEFAQTVVRRLHREGLLGKGMRTPVGDILDHI